MKINFTPSYYIKEVYDILRKKRLIKSGNAKVRELLIEGMYGYEESKKVIMVQEKIKGHTFFYYKEKGEYTYFVLKNSSLSSPEKCFCYYIEYFSGKPETMKKRGNQRFDFVFGNSKLASYPIFSFTLVKDLGRRVTLETILKTIQRGHTNYSDVVEFRKNYMGKCRMLDELESIPALLLLLKILKKC